MKHILVLTICTLVIGIISANTKRKIDEREEKDTNLYDYTKYSYVRKNINSTGEDFDSSGSNESALYFDDQEYIVDYPNIDKSGDYSQDKENEHYCFNSAVLVQGGDAKMRMHDGTIDSSGRGGNGICTTNNGKVGVYRTNINTNKPYSKGLHSTYGGSIVGVNMNIKTKGDNSEALYTYKGVSHIICNACELSTEGSNSSLIHSNGNIMAYSSTHGTASNAQIAVVRGEGIASIEGQSALKANGKGMIGVDNAGVLLYKVDQKEEEGTTTFYCQDSELSILPDSPYYKSAPMFFVTNTDDSKINIENCVFNYGSGVFLKQGGTNVWGEPGKNCGKTEMYLHRQTINGDIIMDDCSEMVLNLVDSHITGVINPNCGKLVINIYKNSSINLRGDSCYTEINNDGGTINNGTHNWIDQNSKYSYFGCCFGEYIKTSIFLIMLIILL
jgi:hypothetical protein